MQSKINIEDYENKLLDEYNNKPEKWISLIEQSFLRGFNKSLYHKIAIKRILDNFSVLNKSDYADEYFKSLALSIWVRMYRSFCHNLFNIRICTNTNRTIPIYYKNSCSCSIRDLSLNGCKCNKVSIIDREISIQTRKLRQRWISKDDVSKNFKSYNRLDAEVEFSTIIAENSFYDIESSCIDRIIACSYKLHVNSIDNIDHLYSKWSENKSLDTINLLCSHKVLASIEQRKSFRPDKYSNYNSIQRYGAISLNHRKCNIYSYTGVTDILKNKLLFIHTGKHYLDKDFTLCMQNPTIVYAEKEIEDTNICLDRWIMSHLNYNIRNADNFLTIELNK